MGKGDMRTKRGKRIRGSYGKSRLRRPVKTETTSTADKAAKE